MARAAARELKEVEFAQLCAIARQILTASRSIDDGEWREQTKVRLARMGFLCPNPEMLSRAMGAVERALEKQWGPRPIPEPPRPPEPPVSPPAWPERRTSRPPGWEIVEDLLRQRESGSTGSLPRKVGPPSER